MKIITRRSALRSLFAAPAIVAASSLMPIRGLLMPAELSNAELIALLDRRLDIGHLAGSYDPQSKFIRSHGTVIYGPAPHYPQLARVFREALS